MKKPIITRYVNLVSRWRKFVINANRVLDCVFGKNKKIKSCGASPLNGETVFIKEWVNENGLVCKMDIKGKVWTMFANGKSIGNPCQTGFRLEFDKSYLDLFGKSLQNNKQKINFQNPA